MNRETFSAAGVTRETVRMRTRDGVGLDACVWRPADAAGPLPVLLMRQPYGRAIASTVVYAHPSWYAARGYIVAIQDVRGRGTSEGDWRLCVHEADDGEDSVAWAAGLPGASGAVGMYGFSYQGMTQMLAASRRPKALRAIAPAMSAWDVRRDFATEGDAFRLQAGLGWGCQLALETARRAGDAALHQAIFAASRSVPLHAEVPCRPPIAAALGTHGHYLDWLTQPAGADYWAAVSPATQGGRIAVPALHVGGWYDPLLAGTLRGWRVLAGVPDQHLVVGPWVHIPWSRHVGERDFGAAASSDIDLLQVRWFDHWLKGADTWRGEPAVRLFEMGGGWRDFTAFPDDPATEWGLTSGGRAGLNPDDGVLGAVGAGADTFVFDPWRPTPSTGGHAGHPAGPIDRIQADARSDVLTYTTPPLAAPLRLAGAVGARLHATADAPSFDLHCVLSELPASGGAFELTSGHRRLDDGGGTTDVDMRATCAAIPAGARLRLSVAAGDFPAFPVNSGTGLPPDQERLIDQRIVTITVRHAGSALLLPVAS